MGDSLDTFDGDRRGVQTPKVGKLGKWRCRSISKSLKKVVRSEAF